MHGMRAMQYSRFGGPEVLSLVDVPEPVPAAGEVLVRVRATSVNPIDWKKASGKLRVIMPVTFPAIPGFDVAGEVVAHGPGVTAPAIGTRVHGRIAASRGGASAELARLELSVLAGMPDGMDFVEAAGMPLAGMTAWQAVHTVLKIPSGAKVAVVGASGGVGHFALQIAVAHGCVVTGVCSKRNAELVRELGAHEVLDYGDAAAMSAAGPFDHVVDAVGADASLWIGKLTPTGSYGTAMPSPQVLLRSTINLLTPRKVYPVMLKSNAADQRSLDALWAAGKLRVVVRERFPLERLGEAWAKSIEGRAVGKIGVEVG